MNPIINIILKYWREISLILLSLVLAFAIHRSNKLVQDNRRQSENFAQVTKDNSLLNLTLSEFKELNTKDSKVIDSLLKVTKIKPKQLKQVTVTNYVYRDTGSTKIVYKEIVQQPDKSFIIPIESKSDCWGMKGQILSNDKNSKFKITEKTANNSVQVIVQKKRGFWFWRKPEKIEVFGDCGEVNATIINLTK